MAKATIKNIDLSADFEANEKCGLAEASKNSTTTSSLNSLAAKLVDKLNDYHQKKILSYLFQMFVHPFCKGFLLDGISFV